LIITHSKAASSIIIISSSSTIAAALPASPTCSCGCRHSTRKSDLPQGPRLQDPCTCQHHRWHTHPQGHPCCVDKMQKGGTE
jgi:hypothetical protein